MNRPIEINPWCIACGFLALAVVTFLVVHPLNSLSSGSVSVGSLVAAVMHF